MCSVMSRRSLLDSFCYTDEVTLEKAWGACAIVRTVQ